MKQALHALLLTAVLLAVSVAAAPAGDQRVFHPQWGFSFQTPQHWVCESDASGAILSFTGGGVTSGDTERRLTICENGRFFSSESGYSGGAGSSGAWSTASQSGSGGTWSISGTKEVGVMSLTYSNGSREDVRYQVCGKGYIYFNNIMYGYEKAAVCD